MARYEHLYTGDIPDDKLLAFQDANGDPMDMSVAGWTCETVVLDDKRDEVGTPRAITNTQPVDTVPHFVVNLTEVESEAMVNTHLIQRPATYYWSTTIRNTGLGLKRTSEIKFAVSKK